MTPPHFTGIGSLPSALGRITGSPPAERRSTGLFHERIPRDLRSRRYDTPRPHAELSTPSAVVLSARQFEYFLARERSLADRGTRRFSLLVLRRRAGEHEKRRARRALTQLACEASKRLRSTDLVGRLDADRVEILLTDTEPAGAQDVAAWLAQVERRLGLELEHSIYVYPSVTEPDGRPHDGPPRGSGRNGHEGSAPANGHALRVLPAAPVRTDTRVQRWPLADLWPQLAVPTPPWKRALDVLVAGLALLVLLPVFALIALAIRLDSPGPVLFRQLRAGRGGRPFVFYKFRSMVPDAERARASLAEQNEQSGPIFKMRADPRVTRVGRWLRRWSADELPQLWNVLKGDISLVGPRSPTLDEVQEYERWQRRRLSVTGGITCIWQVSGRSQIPFRDWMRLDMRYVARRSPWLDFRLLARTLPAVISGRGAC